MTTPTVDTDRIEAAARALLGSKVTAVRTLAEARQQREERRAALAESEREDASAYAAALRAGWTADELKRVGLDASSKRTPGRPRTTRRSTAAAPSPADNSSPTDSPAD